MEQRIDYLSSLKVKGLVIGPIHINTPDNLTSTDLQTVDPRLGTKETVAKLLEAAKKKSKKMSPYGAFSPGGAGPDLAPGWVVGNGIWGVSGGELSLPQDVHLTSLSP